MTVLHTEYEIEQMQRGGSPGDRAGMLGNIDRSGVHAGEFCHRRGNWRELSQRCLKAARIYATHMRNEADRLLEAIGEAITIARDSGARLQVSHLKAQNKSNWYERANAPCGCLRRQLLRGSMFTLIAIRMLHSVQA